MSEDKKDTKFKKGQSGNPKGRPKGALGKNTVPTDEDIITSIQKGSKIAIQKLTTLLSSDNENSIIKAAFKLVDLDVKIRENGGKLEITKKTKGSKEEETYQVDSEDKEANATSVKGKVISMKRKGSN